MANKLIGKRKIGITDLESTEQMVFEADDVKDRADWLKMLIDYYVDDNYGGLRGLQGTVYLRLVGQKGEK